VQYYLFKDFKQHFDDDANSRLAGMQGGLSTRMGAAMRHAAHYLLKQPERRKLLLIVTNGEPADIGEVIRNTYVTIQRWQWKNFVSRGL